MNNVGNLAIAVAKGEPGAAGVRLCEYDDQGNSTRQYLLTCAHIVGPGVAAGTAVFRWKPGPNGANDQGQVAEQIGAVTWASDPSVDGIDVALIELSPGVSIAPDLGAAGIAAGFTSQADKDWRVLGSSWMSGHCEAKLLDPPAGPVAIDARGTTANLSNVTARNVRGGS